MKGKKKQKHTKAPTPGGNGPGRENKASAGPEVIVRDKRFWLKEDLVPTEGEKLDQRVPTFLENLKSQLSQKDHKLQETIDSLREEQGNFKKRVERDIDKQVEQIKMKLIASLLPALDNLGRAMEAAESAHNFDSLLKGIQMVQLQFKDCLRECGAEEIQPENRPFDPKTDEAVQLITVKEREKNNLVLQCLVPGYRLGDKIIRPAQVAIGRTD